MANMQDTRLTDRPGEKTVVEPTPVITPTGTGGVAVYDRGADTIQDPALRTTMVGDTSPAATRPAGSMMTWIIGAIVLIIVAYFLLQMLF